MGLALLMWGQECLRGAAALAWKAAGGTAAWLQGESRRGLALLALLALS